MPVNFMYNGVFWAVSAQHVSQVVITSQLGSSPVAIMGMMMVMPAIAIASITTIVTIAVATTP
jgi:hypothetical protein